MKIEITTIASPVTETDPRVAAVLDMPAYTAVLIVQNSSGTHPFIRDVILRTGSNGWRRAMSTSAGYQTTEVIQRVVEKALADGMALEHVAVVSS